LLLFLSG